MRRRTFLAASAATGAASLLPVTAGAQTANVLLAAWTGPYGGVPPFDKVKVADFAPALEAAMAAELAEVDAIARNPAPADFDNTIGALEKTGEASNRVQT